MYSVIGTKMQERCENWSAFNAGRYSLIGPNGLIALSEWDEKIFPGCKIELKSEPAIGYSIQKPQTLQLPVSLQADDRSSSRSESSTVTVIPRPTTPQSFSGRKKLEVNQLEKLPPETGGTRPSNRNQQSIRPETWDDCIDGQIFPNSVNVATVGQSSDSTLDTKGHLASSIDETDHLTKELGSNLNVYMERDDQEIISRKPRRKNTDIQSYVEDASEAKNYSSVAITGSSLSLYPTKRVGIEISDKETHTVEIELESPFSTSPSKQSKQPGVILFFRWKIPNDSIG